MKFGRILGWLLVALSGFPLTAPTAEITGKVVLSGATLANVVVSIEGLKAGGPGDSQVFIVDHRDLDFVPHVLVVRAGSTVEFKNSDGMPCRVYSISPAGAFVLRRREGQPMTVTFDRPGVVEVRCADHGRIYAYIVVKENPYFALTDPQGRYDISSVPPGEYTLQAWYENQVVKSRTIKVRGERVTADFNAPRPQGRQPGRTLDGNGVPDRILSTLMEAHHEQQ